MRRACLLLLATTLALPAAARPGRGPDLPAHHHGVSGPGMSGTGMGVPFSPLPRPGHRVDRLPTGVATVLIAGLTYYVLNDIFYRPEARGYVVVERPAASVVEPALTTVDVDGRRYYVKEGRYYQRDIDGHYSEVPPPAALR